MYGEHNHLGYYPKSRDGPLNGPVLARHTLEREPVPSLDRRAVTQLCEALIGTHGCTYLEAFDDIDDD